MSVDEPQVPPRMVRVELEALDGRTSGPAVLDTAIRHHPALAHPQFQNLRGGAVDVVGVVFTDDIRADVATGEVHRGDTWMFVIRGRGPAPTPSRAKGKRGGTDKTIALFGTGGIGAPSAIEFAKAGLGKLHLVERDHLDPGNAARWPLGYIAAGHHKLQALYGHLRHQWPYTEVNAVGLSVGGARTDGSVDPQWDILRDIVADADLIYDATAEPGVSYFLSELARDYAIPYVVVTATEGGWGGYAARFRPNPDAPCWTCLMHHFTTNPDLLPPADPDPATRNIWAAGCTDPTFTGTGFDIASIALAGVRLATSTLCEDTPGAYPRADWDYARYAFRSADHALPGISEAVLLDQHPDCNRCRTRQSG